MIMPQQFAQNGSVRRLGFERAYQSAHFLETLAGPGDEPVAQVLIVFSPTGHFTSSTIARTCEASVRGSKGLTRIPLAPSALSSETSDVIALAVRKIIGI